MNPRKNRKHNRRRTLRNDHIRAGSIIFSGSGDIDTLLSGNSLPNMIYIEFLSAFAEGDEQKAIRLVKDIVNQRPGYAPPILLTDYNSTESKDGNLIAEKRQLLKRFPDIDLKAGEIMYHELRPVR